MKMSEISSTPLRLTVKLLKFSASRSQSSNIPGSMPEHSRLCKFLNANNGIAFSFGGWLASSLISFFPGGDIERAGSFVKLLYRYFSSALRFGSESLLCHQPPPSEKTDTEDEDWRENNERASSPLPKSVKVLVNFNERDGQSALVSREPTLMPISSRRMSI